MSQTSKINLQVRNAVINFLKPGTTATNQGLKLQVLPESSLRSIQEATQKLVSEGILMQSKSKGKVWYGIAPANTISAGTVDVHIGTAV